MENLSKMKKNISSFLIFFYVFHYAISQETFFAYKVKGEPYVEANDSIKSITKGSNLGPFVSVTLNKNDILHFINDSGNIYVLNNPGKYSYSDLQMTPAIKDNSSFSKKMFSYMWKEFTNNTASRNDKKGVVYRGDDIILMQYPADSVKIYYDEIKFEWDQIKDKTKDYYFILKDCETDRITKIGTRSTSISLFVDDSILREGGCYKWTITETKFPNYKNTVFYSFKILKQTEFEALDIEIESISKFLLELGFTNEEIKIVLCQDYKLCY